MSEGFIHSVQNGDPGSDVSGSLNGCGMMSCCGLFTHMAACELVLVARCAPCCCSGCLGGLGLLGGLKDLQGRACGSWYPDCVDCAPFMQLREVDRCRILTASAAHADAGAAAAAAGKGGGGTGSRGGLSASLQVTSCRSMFRWSVFWAAAVSRSVTAAWCCEGPNSSRRSVTSESASRSCVSSFDEVFWLGWWLAGNHAGGLCRRSRSRDLGDEEITGSLSRMTCLRSAFCSSS